MTQGGTYIGPRNATIVVSGKHGKSVTRDDDSGYSVNSKGELFVYHTLPELTAVCVEHHEINKYATPCPIPCHNFHLKVSPNAGGVEGGAYLRISGNSFDSYPGMTEVRVGGAECSIVR